MSASTFRLATIVFLTLFGSARIATAEPFQIRLITFDNLPLGPQSGFYPDKGIALFSFTKDFPFTGLIDVERSSRATTGANVAYATQILPDLGGTFFGFRPNIRTPLNATSTFVRFSVISTGGWRAEFINEDGRLMKQLSGEGKGEVIALPSLSADIASFKLFHTTPGGKVGIDSLEFNSPVVPEPGTLLLFGSGISFMLRRHLRKSRRGEGDRADLC
jgi:hypothetical protein